MGKLFRSFWLLSLLLIIDHGYSQSNRVTTLFQTAKSSYTVTTDAHMYRLPIMVIYTNSFFKPVYLARSCGKNSSPEFTFEKQVEEGWAIVTGIPIPCETVGGIPPITVLPGSRYTINLIARGYRNPNEPGFDGIPIPGRYRLVFGAYRNVSEDSFFDLQDPLPTSQNVSNSFELKFP